MSASGEPGLTEPQDFSLVLGGPLYQLLRRSRLATYYAGGQSAIQGVDNDDRQSNSRFGATLVLPIGRRNSIKLGASRGAVVRSGANFTTSSFGWQTGWFPRPQRAR